MAATAAGAAAPRAPSPSPAPSLFVRPSLPSDTVNDDEWVEQWTTVLLSMDDVLAQLLSILQRPEHNAHYSVPLHILSLVCRHRPCAEFLLNHSTRCLPLVDRALGQVASLLLQQCTPAAGFSVALHAKSSDRLHTRPYCLPSSHSRSSIGVIRSADVGRLVCVLGNVMRVQPARMYEYASEWECGKCGGRFYAYADDDQESRIEQPKHCRASEQPEANRDNASWAGARRACRSTFINQSATSLARDVQHVRIQDNLHRSHLSLPRSITLRLTDEQCESVKVGDVVQVCGMVRRQWSTLVIGQRVNIDLYLDAYHIAVIGSSAASAAAASSTPNVPMSEFDAYWDQHRQLARGLKARNQILSAMAPTLVGLFMPKLTCMLALIGGVRKEDGGLEGEEEAGRSDIISIRGDIHVLLVGDAGVGKCFARSTRVRLVSGETIAVEHIVGGEQLMGDDGTPRTVTPGSLIHGRGTMYRISPLWAGARPFTVNGAHILVLVNNRKPCLEKRTRQTRTQGRTTRWQVAEWKVTTDNRMSKAYRGSYATRQMAVAKLNRILAAGWEPLEWEVSVEEYLRASAEARKHCKLIACRAIAFTNPLLSSLHGVLADVLNGPPSAAQLEYMAWWLGIWLTNGHSGCASISQGGALSSLHHHHIFARLLDYQRLFNEPVAQAFDKASTGGWPVYWFGYGTNSVAGSVLRAYGLIDNKHVPRAFICDSIDVRRRLMAGLIDSDGYYTATNVYEIRATHRHVIDGYKELAATLGLRNSAVCPHLSINQQMGEQYQGLRIHISGPMWDVVQHCVGTHKQCPRPDTVGYVTKSEGSRCYGFTITELEEEEYFGFAVHGGTNRRFLLDDYTVTHNSVLLQSACGLSPRGVLTTGAGTTSAGLTVAATRAAGSRSSTAFTLEPGALVLADSGVCCIDEFNSISKSDRTSLLEAMEQQTISIAKGGQVTKLNTRTAVIAALNPKQGKYDHDLDLSVNTALGSALLSRFDVILALLDTRDETWDEKVAEQLLQVLPTTHSSDGVKKQEKDELLHDDMKDDEDEVVHMTQRPTQRLSMTQSAASVSQLLTARWSVATIHSYIAYLKSSFFPVLSPDCESVLKRYYQLQRRSDGRKQARVGVRLLESLIRLTQAHARLMWRQDECELLDAVMAVVVMEHSVLSCGLLLQRKTNVLAWSSGMPTTVSALHADFSSKPDEEFERWETLILDRLELSHLKPDAQPPDTDVAEEPDVRAPPTVYSFHMVGQQQQSHAAFHSAWPLPPSMTAPPVSALSPPPPRPPAHPIHDSFDALPPAWQVSIMPSASSHSPTHSLSADRQLPSAPTQSVPRAPREPSTAAAPPLTAPSAAPASILKAPSLSNVQPPSGRLLSRKSTVSFAAVPQIPPPTAVSTVLSAHAPPGATARVSQASHSVAQPSQPDLFTLPPSQPQSPSRRPRPTNPFSSPPAQPPEVSAVAATSTKSATTAPLPAPSQPPSVRHQPSNASPTLAQPSLQLATPIKPAQPPSTLSTPASRPPLVPLHSPSSAATNLPNLPPTPSTAPSPLSGLLGVSRPLPLPRSRESVSVSAVSLSSSFAAAIKANPFVVRGGGGGEVVVVRGGGPDGGGEGGGGSGASRWATGITDEELDGLDLGM